MTALTTPSTWTAGQTVTAATLNQQVRDNMLHVTEIQTYTPALVQSVTVTKTVNYAKYWQSGKRVHAQAHLTATGTGTAGNVITVQLPGTAAAGIPLNMTLGAGWIYDTSVATFYAGVVLLASTTTVGLRVEAATNFVGSTPSFALASGDIVSFTMDYEVA